MAGGETESRERLTRLIKNRCVDVQWREGQLRHTALLGPKMYCYNNIMIIVFT